VIYVADIKWRTTLREGRIDKYEKQTLLEWRMYSDGRQVLISENLQPSSESEKELAKFLAKENGFECYDGLEFVFQFKENVRISDFQEKVQLMFKIISQYRDDKKTLELLSFRIPKWIKDRVRELEGNDINYSEIVKDALVLWYNEKTKKKYEAKKTGES
jgi:hypothetical protein